MENTSKIDKYRTIRLNKKVFEFVRDVARKNRRSMTAQWELICDMWAVDHPDEVDPELRKRKPPI